MHSIQSFTGQTTSSMSTEHTLEEETNQKILELKLLLEFGCEEECDNFMSKVNEKIQEMYQEKVIFTDTFDYLLKSYSFTTARGYDGTINMETSIHEDDVFFETEISLDKYKELLSYCVVEEINGNINDHYYPLNTEGLVEAIKKFNVLVLKHS